MKCSRWHQRIALYVGGDLETRHVRGVERHLDKCPACRELAEALMGDLEVVAGLKRDELDGVALGSVRGEVMAEVERRPTPPMAAALSSHFRLAMAAAVVAVFVALVVMWPGGGREEPRIAEEKLREPSTAVEVVIEAAPEEPDSPAEIVPGFVEQQPSVFERETETLIARAEPPSVSHQSVVSPSARLEPMTMKILTDDPDVVIYWIVDSKGEKENA